MPGVGQARRALRPCLVLGGGSHGLTACPRQKGICAISISQPCVLLGVDLLTHAFRIVLKLHGRGEGDLAHDRGFPLQWFEVGVRALGWSFRFLFQEGVHLTTVGSR
jgi:hypothetical protein